MKWTKIKGVRLRFRTEVDERGRLWCRASSWAAGENLGEFARLCLGSGSSALEAGDPAYQAWVEATGRVWTRQLELATGLEGIFPKRERADRRGEERSSS